MDSNNSTKLLAEDQKRYNRKILYHYPIVPYGIEEGDVAIYMSERRRAEKGSAEVGLP
jgi:hypothetical protein